MGTEREAKFSAWPGFEMPDLSGLADGVAVGRPSEDTLDAVYFDTKDLRLIRQGITVRHRTTKRGRTTWTVKLPLTSDETTLSRREVEFDLPAGAPPDEVASVVRAHVRTADLVEVAHLQTRRGSVQLRSGRRVVGEVDDDEVSVLDGDRVAARFREVEAEIQPDAPADLLDQLVDRLREAGADSPDLTPKLVRALGPRALQPPDLVPIEVNRKARADLLVRSVVTSATLRVIVHDPIIRIDHDDEAVHQARVGARRLRSDLRTLDPLLEGAWIEPLRAELKWLGQELGAVRDADVLLERLRAEADDLLRDVDRQAADALLARLSAERDEALDHLATTLDSPKYTELLEQLVTVSLDPDVTEEAGEKAADLLPDLVGKPFRKLAKTIDGLGDEPTDDELHEVRKKAKKARYAAELATPVIDDAAELAKRLRALQDVLGDHQDASVAEGWLREAAADAPPEQAMAAGLLISRQRVEAERLRAGWRDVWQKASTKSVTKWLR